MKSLLIITFLFISTLLSAQVDSTENGAPPYFYQRSGFLSMANRGERTGILDTVKCTVMLSDTSRGKVGNVIWRKIWGVRELKYDYFSGGLKYYTHLEYLDKNKKPLSKRLCVFQSFTIK